MTGLAPVYFQLDKKSVDADEASGWSLSENSEGGYDQARLNIPERQARRIASLGQGLVLSAFVDASPDPIWEGRISAAPQIAEGIAHLAASGYKTQLEKTAERLLFQSRDYAAWMTIDSEPHTDLLATEAQGVKMFSVTSEGAKMEWKLAKDGNFTAGDRFPMVFWAEAQKITRVAFTIRKSENDANFEISIRRGDGPTGALTVETTYGLGAGNPDGTAKDYTLTDGSMDMLALMVRCATAVNVTGIERFWLEKLRVNGIATGDTFSADQAAIEVLRRAGFDSANVSGSALNILPLDHTDGSWADLLSYLSSLDDTYWRIAHDAGGGPLGYRRPWGEKTWVVQQSDGANVDLTPLELFNKVSVRYDTLGGVPQEVTALADPDPLAGTGLTNTYSGNDLEDKQPDDTLATAVATTLLQRYSKQLYSGKIDAIRASALGSDRNAIEEIHCGDYMRVADFDQAKSVEVRIMEKERTEAGISFGVEQPVSVAGLLFRMGRAAAAPTPKPKKRKKHKKHHRH